MSKSDADKADQTGGHDPTDLIGNTAGAIWHLLSDNGPLSMTRLVKELGTSRDTVMQGVGWLAREGKLEIVEQKRTRLVQLRE